MSKERCYRYKYFSFYIYYNSSFNDTLTFAYRSIDIRMGICMLVWSGEGDGLVGTNLLRIVSYEVCAKSRRTRLVATDKLQGCGTFGLGR